MSIPHALSLRGTPSQDAHPPALLEVLLGGLCSSSPGWLPCPAFASGVLLTMPASGGTMALPAQWHPDPHVQGPLWPEKKQKV